MMDMRIFLLEILNIAQLVFIALMAMLILVAVVIFGPLIAVLYYFCVVATRMSRWIDPTRHWK